MLSILEVYMCLVLLKNNLKMTLESLFHRK